MDTGQIRSIRFEFRDGGGKWGRSPMSPFSPSDPADFLWTGAWPGSTFIVHLESREALK
jgi:hypothetical protein